MSIFFKPSDGWAGDFIPFYWDNEYHLFYLKDYRDEKGHGLGIPWFHIGTQDFISFMDYEEALPRGSRNEQDLYVFTGCVIERDGLFHIYYTGHNPLFEDSGQPIQAVMHATSRDLVRWEKDPANPILFADTAHYEPDDWRDPLVFWNEEAGEYWMLLAARLKHGPSNRRGCIALTASRDLSQWEIRKPFWAPDLYYTHECPDLFRMGDWWYLVNSTFSERTVTHYRMSRSLAGPWTAPANDSFDGRDFYAAKTISDGQRRFAFGWNPSRTDEKDTGNRQWGGDLVVHEVVQEEDGALSVKVPEEVAEQFTKPVALTAEPRIGQWDVEGDSLTARANDSFAWCSLGTMPSTCSLETTITFSPETRSCGVMLRTDDTLDNYYQIRLEPGRDRVVFDRWPRPGDEPFMIERPLELKAEEPVRLRVLVEDSIIVAYLNDQVALSTRGYDHLSGACGLFVSEGIATFGSTRVAEALT